MEDWPEDELLQAILGEKPMGKESKYTQWMITSAGEYKSCEKTAKELPAGVYTIKNTDKGVIFSPAKFNADALYRITDGYSVSVLKQIERFWESKQNYIDSGLLHKRGILFYGIAGGGKTSLIKLLTDDVIARNGVVIIMNDPDTSIAGFKALREIEPERPIVHIIEDIEAQMEMWDSSSILSMLDGEHQINNVLQLATTNYPEKLEERISQRPGRFDLILEVKMPSLQARQEYLASVPNSGLDNDTIKQWAADTEGLGMAHLRELISAVCCMGLDYDETLARLTNNKKKAPKRKESAKVGFDT
jgi:hypothetical protein